MSDPLADVLGLDDAPRRRGPGRPTRAEAAARALEQQISLKAAASGRALEDVGGVQALRRPVTINTLATVFGHDVQTITRRLIDCPFIPQGNRKLYEFKEACSYIVKPKMTVEQFIATLNKANLPPEINLAFWNANRARLKYMLEAQEAWETGDVLEVFGDAFMAISDTLRTVPEEMRDRARLTDEQTKLLEEGLDELRATLRQKLVEMPAQKQTGSILDQPLFGTAKTIDPAEATAWQAEDDDEGEGTG